MKWNLGELISVDTDDRYHPIVFSDTLVDVFFVGTGIGHLYQAYRYADNMGWLALHGLSAAVSFYWPYMIHEGYTHKGLGHASYGCAALLPHVPSLQVFGGLMVADKVINLNGIVLPGGKHKLFSHEEPLSTYGTDNLFLDNILVPHSLAGLSVNIPAMAISGALQVFGPEQLSKPLTLLDIGLGIYSALSTWKLLGTEHAAK